MYPFLIDVSFWGTGIRVPTYAVMVAFAFIFAYLDSLRRGMRVKQDPRDIETMFVLVVIASMLGSHLFHVVFEARAFYRYNPHLILAVWQGGYTLYGALIGSAVAIAILAKVRRISPAKLFDIVACPTLLGIAIGRLGCLAAGCCWGKPTNLPWGISFSHKESFSQVLNIPLHPTQAYESAWCLLGFILFSRRSRRHELSTGRIAAEVALFYALGRFFIEFTRGDESRGFLFGIPLLSYSQAISLAILMIPLLRYGTRRLSQKTNKVYGS